MNQILIEKEKGKFVKGRKSISHPKVTLWALICLKMV